jgi:hypothetical protein
MSSSLQWMQACLLRQAFNRDDLLAGNALHRQLTGSDSLAVHDDSTGAALILPAAIFRAGQPKIRAQHPKELSFSVRGHADWTVVESETNGFFHRRSPFFLSGHYT